MAASYHSILTQAALEITIGFFASMTNELFICWEVTDRRLHLTQQDIVGELLRGTGTHLSVRLETGRPLQLNRTRLCNAFVVDDFDALSRITNKMDKQKFDYSGFYLIIVTDPTANSYRTVKRIVEKFWQRYIVNVAILAMKEESTERVFMYTYFPYGENYCEQAQPVVWNVYNGGRFVDVQRLLFPPKLANLYGCSLAVATFPTYPFMMIKDNVTSGIEGILLNDLSQRLNFCVKLVLVLPAEWGHAGSRGTSTGAAKYVRNGEVNFTIGYWATTYMRNQYMSASYSYYTSLMVIAVPPGPPYSALEKLTMPFQLIVWLCLLVMVAMAITTIVTVRRRHRNIRRLVFGQPNPDDPVLTAINLFLGGALVRVPVGNFARTLLAIWLFGTAIIRTSYTSALFDFLQSQRNKTVPASFGGLMAADYELLMYRNYSYVFDVIPWVGRQVQLITAQQFRMETIAQLQDPRSRRAIILPIETVTFLNQNLTQHGQILRITKSRVFVSKLAIYCQRSSPLLQPFNTVLQRLTAAGLISRWASIYHQERFLTDQYRTRSKHRKLLLPEVAGCFAILLFGLTLACCAFFLELLPRGRKKTIPFTW